jgi:hypothetical protein
MTGRFLPGRRRRNPQGAGKSVAYSTQAHLRATDSPLAKRKTGANVERPAWNDPPAPIRPGNFRRERRWTFARCVIFLLNYNEFPMWRKGCSGPCE